METLDEQLVQASVRTMFEVVRHVEEWPAHLAHYRFVRVREAASDGGGLVEMSAYRPFGLLGWPTWWLSEMEVDHATPAIRFRHVEVSQPGWTSSGASRRLTAGRSFASPTSGTGLDGRSSESSPPRT